MLQFIAILKSVDGDPSTFEMAVHDAVDLDDAAKIAIDTATDRYGDELFVVGVAQEIHGDFVARALTSRVTTMTTDDDEIDALRRRSKPVPGCDGYRADADGRRWYSARWLGR